MTDDQLIQRFLSGDLDAFNTLVWRWQSPVYNFVLRYLGRREDARDACQKTFLRAYRQLHKLRNRERFRSWLYQIAVNICRDELKRRHRRPHVSLENLQARGNGKASQPLQLGAAGRAHPEEQMRSVELTDLVTRALQEIPEEQRAIIVMKEFQGLTFTEIADVLQMSVNTVKSRMYYGLSALRKVFKKWNITQEMLRHEM